MVRRRSARVGSPRRWVPAGHARLPQRGTCVSCQPPFWPTRRRSTPPLARRSRCGTCPTDRFSSRAVRSLVRSRPQNRHPPDRQRSGPASGVSRSARAAADRPARGGQRHRQGTGAVAGGRRVPAPGAVQPAGQPARCRPASSAACAHPATPNWRLQAKPATALGFGIPHVCGHERGPAERPHCDRPFPAALSPVRAGCSPGARRSRAVPARVRGVLSGPFSAG